MVSVLCGEKLGVKSYTHIIEPSRAIPDGVLPELLSCMERLMQAEPLQYVLGYAEFCGRRFKVDGRVLIPRPETEQLVGLAEERMRASGLKAGVLDLCTGSGCIAWSLRLDFPGTEVTAVDISGDALELACSQFPVPGPEFVQADIRGPVPELVRSRGPYGLIVSNPPYVLESERAAMRSNVLDHEPGLALFVPDDDPLVFYRACAAWAADLLAPDGCVLFEINEAFGPQTASMMRSCGFTTVEVLPDLYGKPRFVRACREPDSRFRK